MELIQSFFEHVYNVQALAQLGLLVLVAIIFAETGLLIGFFLPGDSLLVAAGIFAARGELNIVTLNLALIAAAIVGDATGYWIGRRTGRALYNRPDSLFFKRRHLALTQAYYDQHGGKTIVFARFIPIIRTFAPVVAGMADMGYRRFAFYNVIGGIAWITSMTIGGYALGSLIPGIESKIHVVIAVVIAVSLVPPVWAWLKNRRAKAHATEVPTQSR